jgi:hypothetical protein
VAPVMPALIYVVLLGDFSKQVATEIGNPHDRHPLMQAGLESKALATLQICTLTIQ